MSDHETDRFPPELFKQLTEDIEIHVHQRFVALGCPLTPAQRDSARTRAAPWLERIASQARTTTPLAIVIGAITSVIATEAGIASGFLTAEALRREAEKRRPKTPPPPEFLS